MSIPSVTALLQELIRIPSVNPDNDSGPDCGEKQCAEFVAGFLEGLGAEVALEEVQPGRPNVIGCFTAPGKPRVLLGPHVDTVGVANMSIDPFGAELRDGRIYGRGASDTKGTMAAMLWAIREMGDSLRSLDSEISFVGFMGEETNQAGSIHFAKHHPDFAFALVGEPTGLDVVYTTKGCSWIRLTCEGKAAHGSMPEAGENAVCKAANLIGRMETELPGLLAPFRDSMLGDCTFNVGVCQGGTRPNIVPDKCVVELDVRSTPALAERGVKAFFSEFLESEHVLSEILTEKLPMHTPVHNPYVEKLVALGAKPMGAPWFCDAAHLAAAGIPAVAAGPGSITQAHTADEWLAVDDLEEGVGFYRRFLESC